MLEASINEMTVRRMLGLAFGVAGMASVGLAAPAVAVENPNPGRTYIVDCQGELEYKPKEIVFACGEVASTSTRSRGRSGT